MKCVNIEKTYDDITVLRNISISFEEKGLVFILGKSGSGKSTLLNILATLDKPEKGELQDGGLQVNKLSQKELDIYRKNNIGFIFQDYCLIPEVTVAENVAMGDAYADIDKEKILNILAQLNIREICDKKASELSGGQQQRVSIARALYKQSRIILADEPTGNLDKENGRATFEILKEISRNRLIIVVTHDRESANEFGDRIIEIEDGKINNDSLLNSQNEESGKKQKTSEQNVNNLNEKNKVSTSNKLGKINKNLLHTLSIKFENQNKIKKIFSILLISLVLFTLGITLAVCRYDFGKLSASMLTKVDSMPSIGICSGYTNSISGDFRFGPRPIDETDMIEFNKCYENDKDYYYNILGAAIGNGDTGSAFLLNKIKTAVISSEERLKMYDFSIEYGDYPTEKKEVAITDYMAYSVYLLDSSKVMKIVGVDSKEELKDKKVIGEYLNKLPEDNRKKLLGDKSMDEMVEIVVKNPGLLLLDQKIDFTIDSYLITGIINTEYEKYEDMIYMDEEQLNKESRYKEFFYLTNLYYYNFYVSDTFVSDLYSNGLIFFDSGISAEYSKVKEYLDVREEPGEKEIYMSSGAFRNEFEEEFNPEKIGTYKIKIESSTSYEKGGPNDIYFDGGEVNVIGVFDLPRNYLELFGTDDIMVFSDKYYSEYAKHQVYCWMIQMRTEDKTFDFESFVNTLDEREWYYYNYYSLDLYNFTAIMHIFRKIFVTAFIVIFLFSAFIIINYFVSIVMNKKKDIGIMRALGISVKDIKKVFIQIALRIMVIVSFIAVLMFTIGVEIVNGILSDSYLAYVMNTELEKLRILNYSVESYAVMIIGGFVMLFMAVLLPLRKIAKINAIDVIRKS